MLGSLAGPVSRVGSSGFPKVTCLDYWLIIIQLQFRQIQLRDKKELSGSPNCPGLGTMASRTVSSPNTGALNIVTVTHLSNSFTDHVWTMPTLCLALHT